MQVVRRGLVVSADYLLNFNADGSQLGALNRAIPIKEIASVGLSKFRDSYVVVSTSDAGGGYA